MEAILGPSSYHIHDGKAVSLSNICGRGCYEHGNGTGKGSGSGQNTVHGKKSPYKSRKCLRPAEVDIERVHE